MRTTVATGSSSSDQELLVAGHHIVSKQPHNSLLLGETLGVSVVGVITASMASEDTVLIHGSNSQVDGSSMVATHAVWHIRDYRKKYIDLHKR